jgi:outer membrane protein assembly factor BamB
MARELGPRTTTESWIERHGTDALAQLMFNRTLEYAAVLTPDRVHFVDELALLPPAPDLKADISSGIFSKAIQKNEIKTTSLETGKLVTKVPQSGSIEADLKKTPLLVFLGAPVLFGDNLHMVFEIGGKLRVRCFDLQKYDKWRPYGKESDIADSIKWEKELSVAPTSVIEDPHRRIHAIHLVQAGDLILCPTHLGRVVAVDSKTGKIRWTHEYAPLDAKRFPTFAPEWVVVPPVVVGDKYVYAPADFPELLCLNVADGKKVWSVKKGDGLYPAVVGEQVLVIGEKTLRSLDLKDGKEKWKLDLPGLPCGRGAVLGEHYLVPVSEPKTWRGMIAMVDVKNGKISEVIKPDKDEPVGNLVVHQDFLISQTLTEIAVFPIRK